MILSHQIKEKETEIIIKHEGHKLTWNSLEECNIKYELTPETTDKSGDGNYVNQKKREKKNEQRFREIWDTTKKHQNVCNGTTRKKW